MAALGSQSIASSYEQLLHVDTDGGGNTTTLVPVKDGDNGTLFAAQLSTTTLCIDNPTTSSTTQGGILRLQSDDGAVMASGHRLGVIEFGGAEDTSSTITTGARIEAVTDAIWSASENGANLNFYTTDGDASTTQKMTILAGGNVGIGTADPESPLHIYEDTSTTTNAAGLTIENDGTGDAKVEFLATGVNRWSVGLDNSDADKFKISHGSDLIGNDFIIDVTGNVGIGEASPSSNLHISGDNAASAWTGFTMFNDDETSSGETSQTIDMQFKFNSSRSSTYAARNAAKISITKDSDYFNASDNGNEEDAGMVFYTAINGTFVSNMKLDGNSHISLSNNDTGSGVSNTILGKNAGDMDGAGDTNVFIGELVGGLGTQTDDCDGNIGIGYRTLEDLTEGSNNVAIGKDSARNLTAGDENIVIGSTALDAADGGESSNIAIGYNSMGAVDEGANDNADANIAIGQNALTGGTLTDGAGNLSHNIAIGYDALADTGVNDHLGTIAIGYAALGALTSGGGNLAIGYQAGATITTASHNTFIGYGAADALHVESAENVAVGRSAMGGNVGAAAVSYNTAIGRKAMGTGTLNGAINNTAVGYAALTDLTTGGSNTVM